MYIDWSRFEKDLELRKVSKGKWDEEAKHVSDMFLVQS